MIRCSSGRVSRRAFLKGTGVLGGAALLAPRILAAGATSAEGLARRVLGRTKEEVSVLALGTWPSGKCKTVDMDQAVRIVEEALDLGINYVDSARAYDKAEEAIGRALAKRRDRVFLTTKVWADTADEAKSSFEQSLRLLKTDHVDLLFLHSVGDRDVEKALGKNGALSYLLQQKEAGKTRFLGISGHCKPDKFVRVLETGHIDVMMVAMNFVDRHIYGFEEKVLPVANRLNVGVACMKVYGGIRGTFADAVKPNPGANMPIRHLEQAVRYAMGLPGVATLVIGPHTVEQLRQNVQFVKNYRPLSTEELASLDKLGRELASEWGSRFGPVA
jgi:predicted aldo/keto reductase-like oxidoreductase